MSFQSNAFQNNAFQIKLAANDNGWLGGGAYVTPYQRHEQAIKEKIRKEKTELEKLDSVLEEYKRKQEQAARNKLLAQKKAALRLAELENDYLKEINRLMQVRALLMLNIKRNEEALIVILMMRRRLRAA
jgi:hypothetical protein